MCTQHHTPPLSPSPVGYFFVTTKLEPKNMHAISTAMRPTASADAAIFASHHHQCQ